MAITRTQIAKQLLAQGGRTGFQGGGADMGKERGPETGRELQAQLEVEVEVEIHQHSLVQLQKKEL